MREKQIHRTFEARPWEYNICDCGKRKIKKSDKCIKCYSVGSNNPQWSGDDVGYYALHGWVRRHKTKPDFCEKCNKNKAHDLANISGEYKRDVNDYEYLCRRCHMLNDGRMANLKQYSTMGI